MRIDLNADLGEGYGPWAMGDDAAMMSVVTSANIACGGHAGDESTMARALTQAARAGVAIGAHPGYADRQGFGRRVIPMAPEEISRMVAAQVGALMGVAALVGARVAYVKPHGALANLAARDRQVAGAIIDATRAIGGLAILAISGSALHRLAQEAGLPVHAEIFADRGYLPDGQLVPRDRPGALIEDPGRASARLLDFLRTGRMPTAGGPPVALAADSVCVHGDSPGALAMARRIRADLAKAGVTLAPFIAPGGGA